MLCPSETRPDEMAQCPVIALEMFRSYFRCLVLLKGPHESLIPVANRMIDLFQGFGSESSLCKMMLTVTLLELHGGDVVRAEQTYLNSHLNNSVYIKSKECEVADLYVLAFKRQDITKLDEAKGHMQLNYLDAEIQAIARNLSLFRTRPDYNPHDPHTNEINVSKPPQTESTPINNDTAAAADSESGDQHEEEGEELEGGQYGMAGVTSVHQEYDPEIYEDEIDLS